MAIRITQKLIAPCGMNCAICKAYLRRRNPCHGCHAVEQNNPQSRFHCSLRICTRRKGSFCFDCEEFPCRKLKQMDLRYRTRYGMSEIENLLFIRDHGIRRFIAGERERWLSEGGILCIHDKKIYNGK